MEGNLRFKIDWASLIVYFVFEGIFKYKRPGRGEGAYIWRGDLTEGFLGYEFGGLIFGGLTHGGAYFGNFTVCCGSILSLVLILFSFVSNSLSCITIPKNKRKEN